MKKYNSFYPGNEWLDTAGKPIQAHGFHIFFDKNLNEYCWVGANHEFSHAGALFGLMGLSFTHLPIFITGQTEVLLFHPLMIYQIPFTQPIKWTDRIFFIVKKPENI